MRSGCFDKFSCVLQVERGPLSPSGTADLQYAHGHLAMTALTTKGPGRLHHDLAYVIAGALTLALAPALIDAPLQLTPERVLLLAALAVVAVVAHANQVVLSRRVEEGVTVDRLLFDARGVLMVIAIGLVGPLAAFTLEALPELASRRVNGMFGRVANIASYGWGALAAAGVLQLLGDPGTGSRPALAAGGALTAAGLVYFVVNFLIARGLVGALGHGRSLVALIRQELVPALPAVTTIVLAAAASGVLTAAVGPVGLLPLAVAAAAPQLALTIITQSTPSACSLSIEQARTHYAAGLADQLRISRRQRRTVLAASRGKWASPQLTGGRGDICHSVGETRFYRDEHYDGSGWLGIYGRWIPLESRVLAVAQAWAELTAKGTSELSHAAALHTLQRQQAHFDPHVLAGAHDLVDAELDTELASSRAPTIQRPIRRLAQLTAAH
jgi:hypothetical protein